MVDLDQLRWAAYARDKYTGGWGASVGVAIPYIQDHACYIVHEGRCRAPTDGVARPYFSYEGGGSCGGGDCMGDSTGYGSGHGDNTGHGWGNGDDGGTGGRAIMDGGAVILAILPGNCGLGDGSGWVNGCTDGSYAQTGVGHGAGVAMYGEYAMTWREAALWRA